MNIPNFICISKYIITYTYNMSSFDKKHDTCIVTGRYLQRIHVPSIHHQELEGFLKKYIPCYGLKQNFSRQFKL